MSYPRDMRLWDQLQRRALNKARLEAQQAYLEKMRAPVSAAAPAMAEARIAQAKKIVAQTRLDFVA